MSKPPHKGPKFEALVSEIDRKLVSEGVDIPSRPLRALREVSTRFNLKMPLSADSDNLPADLRENAPLSDAIHQWYEINYGDRLNTDPCPGRIGIALDGDLYCLRIPRIFGSVNFVVTRDWLPDTGIARQEPTVNIVQLVEGMTPARAARLSDEALRMTALAFEVGAPAAYTLESSSHDLLRIARGDVDVAIRHLMAREERYGESKWASLQVAEKVMKAAISLNGAHYEHTHGLASLSQSLADIGLQVDLQKQIDLIQCGAGIRYGELQCSRNEALNAHHASLDLINVLREAGAKFQLGIDGIERTA